MSGKRTTRGAWTALAAMLAAAPSCSAAALTRIPAAGAVPSVPAAAMTALPAATATLPPELAPLAPASLAAPAPSPAQALAAALPALRERSYVVIPARRWLTAPVVAALEERMRTSPKNVESFYNQGRAYRRTDAETHAAVMELFALVERGLNETLADEGPFKAINVRAHYAASLDRKDGVAVDTRDKHVDTTKITAALTLAPSHGRAGTVYVDEHGVERHAGVGDLLIFSGSLRPKVLDGTLAALLHGSPDFPGKRLALFAFYNATGLWRP